MRRFIATVLDGTGTLLVLLAAAAGVIAADRYLAATTRRVTWADLVIGLVGAAVIVGRSEFRSSDPRGKKSRLLDRALNAFSHGATWRMAGGLAGQIGGSL